MTVILPYIVLLVVSAILLVGLAAFVIRARPPSGLSFTVLLLGVALWSLSHVGELLSTTQTSKALSIDVMYIGISLTMLSWLAFTISYSGNSRWLTNRRIAALSAFYVIMLPIIWTDPYHHLFYEALGVAVDGPFPSATHVIYGPIFWVNVAYSYTLLVVGLVILMRALIRSPQLFRGQIAALIVGALVPFGFSLGQISGVINPTRYTDITPLGFSITGLIFGWAVLRRRLFTVVPIARDMVIENMTDGMFILDSDDYVVDLNPEAEQIIERRAEEVVGRPVLEVLSDRADLIERYRDVPQALDEIILSREGEPHWYELRISPIYSRWSELTGRLIELRDITEDRRIQRELQNRLRETLVMNRVLGAMTSSSDLIHILETICRELAQAFELPQAAIAILEKESPDLTVVVEYLDEGRPSALGQTIPIAGNPLTEMALSERKAIVVTDVFSDPRTETTRAIHSERGTVSLMIVPLFIRDQVFGTLGLDAIERREFTEEEVQLAERVAVAASQALENARLFEALQVELTERRRAQAALEIAKEEAESASRAKSTFLANMSHELRTPLNSILGYLELLLEGIYGPIPEKQADRLEAVRRNSAHLLHLINDVLDLSKIEAGRTELEIEPIPLSKILDECVKAIEGQAVQKGLSIRRDYDDLPRVVGDVGRVRQVINNLLGNAVKFTDEGSVSVSARVIQRGEEANCPIPDITTPAVLVAVRDTGIGIAPQDHEIIFDEFRQVDSSTTRKYEGTGLGLAITRKLVEMMEGHIWVESELGQGSTFCVTLPVADIQ